MGRLIDADALERIIKMEHCMVINGHLAIRKPSGIYRPLLDEMPTAFDIENVVAELEFLKYPFVLNEYNSKEKVVNKTIDIVRKGGVE